MKKALTAGCLRHLLGRGREIVAAVNHTPDAEKFAWVYSVAEIKHLVKTNDLTRRMGRLPVIPKERAAPSARSFLRGTLEANDTRCVR